MNDFGNNLKRMISGLTIGQRAGLGAAAVVVALAGMAFFQWVGTPSYDVLYGNVDQSQMQTVIDTLNSNSIPYRVEGAGRILVPRSQVYQERAALASAGVSGTVVPKGYELLDKQGLSVSDFRQRVDYQRALEGELSRTLTAMDGIRSATVRLVIPEPALFTDQQKPVTASVLIDPAGSVSQNQVEAIAFLVASSVEGLDPNQVTVATTGGNVLQAAGDTSPAAAGNAQLRMTKDYEAALTADVASMLATVLGPGRASVVVRAALDFNSKSTESEKYDKASATALKQ